MIHTVSISAPVPFATRNSTVTTAVKSLADFFTSDEITQATGVLIYASAAVFIDWVNAPSTTGGFPITAAGVVFFDSNIQSLKIIAGTGTVNLWIGLTS